LDLRVADTGADKLQLVPVLLARLHFDESVQGGDVVTFQLGETDLQAIEEEVNRLRLVMARLRREVPESSG
jgi:hypothetical protein